MKLRTKLLLGVGILLFAMVIIMYALPTFFVRKDVYKAADEIHQLLIEDHRQLIRSQQVWVDDVLVQTKQNSNSLLYMLYEEPSFSSKLLFNKDNPDVNVWNGLARVAGYDPAIGFIQAHSVKENKSAVISPHTAEIFTVDKYTKKGNLSFLSIRDINDDQIDLPFIGIPLPKEFQTEPGYRLYALIDPDKIPKELAIVHEEFTHLTPEIIKKQLDDMKPLHLYGPELSVPGYFWAIKINLIRVLTPLFFEGLSLNKKAKILVPEGIARVDSTNNGYAILTEHVFRTKPLFNDRLYYENHQPASVSPPLANGNVLVTEKEGDHAYIGNTLLLDSTYITIGNQLSSLVKQLALSSNKMILLKIKDDFWLGYDGQGNKLSEKEIKSISKTELLNEKRGMITINDQPYFFARISSLENGDLVFYDFHPTGGDNTIIGTLLSLEDKLSSRISVQLSLISMVTMILVLLFIGRIGFSVIYPVTKLAQATQYVVTGRYEDVTLPDVGQRKDEVATLTRSFGDMVKGLQEREKIRGVLDKVVSKDVADEILRTQIHLGGEDRVVSMLFSDIRGFTKLTENVPPQKTIQMLNACMTKISRVIEGEGGVIDKYVGDEVMAIFGAPTTHPDHALRAVSTGMLIIETLKKWNQERAAAGEPLIEMGIGVHTGLVVAGNMGAEDRLNYTVLGANVNLAARLCDVAKPNQLIISEVTLAEPNIEESFYAKPLEPISLKGFSSPVRTYEIAGFKWEES